MGRFGHSGDWLRCNAKHGLSHPNWMHLSRNNPHVDCLSSKKSTYAVNWVVNLSHSLAESVFRAVTSWRTLPGCSGLCWSSEGFTKQVHLPRPITYHDTPLWFSKGQANRESKLLTRISYFLFPFKLPYPPQCRGAHLAPALWIEDLIVVASNNRATLMHNCVSNKTGECLGWDSVWSVYWRSWRSTHWFYITHSVLRPLSEEPWMIVCVYDLCVLCLQCTLPPHLL